MRKLTILMSAAWMTSVALYGTGALAATQTLDASAAAAEQRVVLQDYREFVRNLQGELLGASGHAAATAILQFLYHGSAVVDGREYVCRPSSTPITPEETVHLQNVIIMAVVAGGQLPPRSASAPENLHQRLVRFTYRLSRDTLDQSNLGREERTLIERYAAPFMPTPSIVGTGMTAGYILPAGAEEETITRLQNFANIGTPGSFAERCRGISAEFAEHRAQRQQEELGRPTLQRVSPSDLLPPTGGPMPTSPRAAATSTGGLPAALDFDFAEPHSPILSRQGSDVRLERRASQGALPAADFTDTAEQITYLFTTGRRLIDAAYELRRNWMERMNQTMHDMDTFERAMRADMPGYLGTPTQSAAPNAPSSVAPAAPPAPRLDISSLPGVRPAAPAAATRLPASSAPAPAAASTSTPSSPATPRAPSALQALGIGTAAAPPPPLGVPAAAATGDRASFLSSISGAGGFEGLRLRNRNLVAGSAASPTGSPTASPTVSPTTARPAAATPAAAATSSLVAGQAPTGAPTGAPQIGAIPVSATRAALRVAAQLDVVPNLGAAQARVAGNPAGNPYSAGPAAGQLSVDRFDEQVALPASGQLQVAEDTLVQWIWAYRTLSADRTAVTGFANATREANYQFLHALFGARNVL